MSLICLGACFILYSSVIVSQWTSMLKVIALHLRRHKLTYATIDGSVSPKQRMDLVEAFNNSRGPEVRAGHIRVIELRANFSQLYREF